MSVRSSRTRPLVEGALMIALATVLFYIKVFTLPQGGAITLEMLPLVIMALRNGPRWGCFTGLVHGLLQMLLGFSNVLYCATLPSQVACILLDYLLAFTLLGLAPVFARPFHNARTGAAVGAVAVGLLRFACSFLSGIVVWHAYAPEGTPVWIYSLTYNGSYMVPSIILTAAACTLLYKLVPRLFKAD